MKTTDVHLSIDMRTNLWEYIGPEANLYGENAEPLIYMDWIKLAKPGTKFHKACRIVFEHQGELLNACRGLNLTKAQVKELHHNIRFYNSNWRHVG